MGTWVFGYFVIEWHASSTQFRRERLIKVPSEFLSELYDRAEWQSNCVHVRPHRQRERVEIAEPAAAAVLQIRDIDRDIAVAIKHYVFHLTIRI